MDRISNSAFGIRQNFRYFAGYSAKNPVSSQISGYSARCSVSDSIFDQISESGKIPGIRSDIQPDIWYLTLYPVFGQIYNFWPNIPSDIRPNLWTDIRYIRLYPTSSNISNSVSGIRNSKNTRNPVVK